jgi:multiple sugar transport system permease protein
MSSIRTGSRSATGPRAAPSAPLDDFLAKESGIDAVRREDFYPATWNEALYQGKIYAIPTGVDDRMLLYSKEAFRDAGMDPEKPPRTWEELRDAAKKLTKLNADGTYKRIGFIPNYGNSWLYLYSWQNGGEFLSPDTRTVTLANDRTVGALDYMVSLYDALGGNDKISIFQSSFQGGEQNPFYTGKIGCLSAEAGRSGISPVTPRISILVSRPLRSPPSV